MCPWGCGVIEDYDHIVASCGVVKRVIALFQLWGYSIPAFDNLEETKCGLLSCSSSNPQLGRFYCGIIYRCWRARCRMIHGQSFETPLVIASSIVSNQSHLTDLSVHVQWGSDQSLGLFCSIWSPPPPGWLKINCDGCLLSNYSAAIGIVIRQSDGSLVKAAGRTMVHWDNSKVELEAVKFIASVLELWMIGMNGIIIEGDNSTVILAIRNWFKNPTRGDGLLEDNLMDALMKFNTVLFNVVHRSANRGADFCARWALKFNNSFVWFNTCYPREFGEVLVVDYG